MSGSTKYQIRGIPGHCREEHLVVVKSIIQMFIGKKSKTCLRTGKPRSSQNEGCIIQIANFMKFFDSENLRRLLGYLFESKVNKNACRIWFKLNQRAVISPLGTSEKAEAGDICPKGGFGGALVGGLDLARGCHSYFGGSQDEVSYGRVRCNPQLYQDDWLRAASSVGSARVGLMNLLCMTREKQLTGHPKKY